MDVLTEMVIYGPLADTGAAWLSLIALYPEQWRNVAKCRHYLLPPPDGFLPPLLSFLPPLKFFVRRPLLSRMVLYSYNFFVLRPTLTWTLI